MAKPEWTPNSTAYITTEGYGVTFYRKLREVELVRIADNSDKVPVWQVRFDEVDDDAEISNHVLSVPENELYKTVEDALAAAAAEFKATLLNEMHEWREEIEYEK